MSRWIVPLKKVKSAERFGQKALNLARLSKWEFNVPITHVLSSEAFQTVVEKMPEIRNIESYWTTKDTRLYQLLVEVQNKLTQLTINLDLKTELETLIEEWQSKNIHEVAVRSSAISEDKGDFSFAGQYATVLHVPLQVQSLWEAIKTVWSSVFEKALWEYCQKNDLPAPDLKMAVILQAMVPAEFAGVAFSIDPNRPESEQMIIEYVSGTGEALVSGEVTPEQLKVERLNTSRLATLNVPFKNLDSFVQEILRLEKLSTQAVDVEWAYARQQFYFLQFRPVTTLKNAVVWTRENVGEVIPDVVTPFTWSILEPMANRAYHFFLKKAGIKVSFKKLFTLYQGKVYFNHKAYHQMINHFYLSNYLVRGRPRWLNGLNALRFSVILLRLLQLSQFLPAQIRAVIKKQGKAFNRYRERNAPDRQFKAIKTAVNTLNELMKIHISATILAELYYQLLDKFCYEALPEIEADASKLLQGIGQMESIKPTLALWEIAHWIQENERYRKVFLEKKTNELIAWWETLPPSDILRQELEIFLENFGHAALHEFEISYPRWREDLHYIFSTLKTYVSARTGYTSINKQYRQTEKDRQNIINSVKNHLEKDGSKIKKKLFEHLLNKAEYFSFYREFLKQKILKWLDFLKQNLILIGKQYFKDEQDIFYLKFLEIQDLLQNRMSEDEAEFLILLRKNEREKQLRVQHPFKVQQIGEQWIPVVEEFGDEHELKGLPCSSGIVEGRACVVLDAQQQGDQFKNGDILVTRATNPGWTPLMALAGGIVTEIGGALSHGAIIAREFSIPMVASVPNATQIIQTGQWIKVNGQTGTVEILKGVGE